MAALLRSARLLKFSPSGLLQITGPKRSGPPLGRLYSGAVGGRRAGVCSRQISRVGENASSRVWPYAVGGVRNYGAATERRDEVSVAVQSKQANQFDWALAKLDHSVKRTGRVTKTLLLRIFHDICRTGYPSSNQALLLLRSCGSLLPEMPLNERTELAHHVWGKLQELRAQYDVSHYNALLKVYLQNEFEFSPTDFLAKMEAADILPNRVTYQRLITAYCQKGDIEGASTILGFMKSKDLPITEAVFSSLVTGHARTGDMESAKNILPVMQQAGIEPGPDTYVSLLMAYAERGDIDSIKQTLEAAENADCRLMDRDIMQVIFVLAKSGYHEHIPEMIECLKHERGYVPDAMNLCLSLITQGQEDTAFLILKTLPVAQFENLGDAELGNFFLRHLVNRDTSLEKISRYCKELQESSLHSTPLTFSLYCALEAKKTDTCLELMKLVKAEGLPLRPHYFWPLLVEYGKNQNTTGVLEIIKAMQGLGVSLDLATLSNHVMPLFSSAEAAQQAFKAFGITTKSGGFVCSGIRLLAGTNLAELYTLISDPSFPPLDIQVFCNSLLTGFKKFNDMDSMVKIVVLLYNDGRFTRRGVNTTDAAGFFLYNLIDSMSEKQLKAQEKNLRSFFKQLHTQNITISQNIYRGIKNLLELYNTPELLKNVNALKRSEERTSISPAVELREATDNGAMVLVLENRLAELKAEKKPVSPTLKQAINALCAEENLQRALKLKQQYEEDMTPSIYALLINLCCRLKNADEALNLKRELNRKDSSAALDGRKYVTLVRTLSLNGKVEEAVDILKEMKEKDVVMKDPNITGLFHTFCAVADTGDVDAVQRLQDTAFTLGLIKPSANLCSPAISAYLKRDDLAGALEAVQQCYKRYKHLPRMHDILVGLVEIGDTESLQKAMDFMSHERGEMIMLYDLFFAFLQAGRYREARKIMETPGMRAKPTRMQWYAEKCISTNQMETLEQMVDMTAKLFDCDRDDMYGYILQLCKKTNNWQKAEAMWTKMQEENFIPQERTLRLVADILRKNGQNVPFEVPETWYDPAKTPQLVKLAAEAAAEAAAAAPPPPPTAEKTAAAAPVRDNYDPNLFALCKKGNVEEAYALVKKADEQGLSLRPGSYDCVLRALLARGSDEDAMVVKDIARSHLPNFQLSENANNMYIITLCKKGQIEGGLETLKSMLQSDQVPSFHAITKLVQALGAQGDVERIQYVESQVKILGIATKLSSMLFPNNTALAHIKNGDVESAVELLEGLYTDPHTIKSSMSFLFRKVLQSDDDNALDKLSAMAERLANHFACYIPATDLFLQLLEMGKVEEAKFMLARCNAVAEQKTVLLSYVTEKAQMPGQLDKIKTLVSLIPDAIEKEVLYSYTMKCHDLDKDFTSAKALYKEMMEEGIAADELFLKRLAALYRNAGETPPFIEPPESFKFYANKLRESRAKAQATAEE
ncbi:leucine-rich PPR motif-containing protein, mitochondrial [Stegastes partitus]|uniref:Leucine rich pentatricopeptide repeat containing n=1 Tax=Stegastes partitus TaxID=144197 RepID=A0A3B4Z0B9_9TELE|nr:PREDICTED: leucine-rich PPR motif-containing protein, mitochondrial [Stegastes partitus]